MTSGWWFVFSRPSAHTGDPWACQVRIINDQFFRIIYVKCKCLLPGGATPGKMIMGLKVVKCTHIIPLGLNRVQVTPASDLGFGWALVRSVLKNFSLGKVIIIIFS